MWGRVGKWVLEFFMTVVIMLFAFAIVRTIWPPAPSADKSVSELDALTGVGNINTTAGHVEVWEYKSNNLTCLVVLSVPEQGVISYPSISCK